MSQVDFTKQDKRKAVKLQPLEGNDDAKRRGGYITQPLNIGQLDETEESYKPTNTEVFQEGDYLYSCIAPNRLVLNVDCHVRMLEDENMDLESRSTETRSVIEPFRQPLPLPPNCHLYQKYREKLLVKSTNYGVRRMAEPITIDNGQGVKIRVGIAPSLANRLLDPPNAVPYNAYNLRFNSMGYLYEDSWNLEETRPVIAKTLLFEDYKKLERERQARQLELLKHQATEKQVEVQNTPTEESEKKQRDKEKSMQEEKEKAEMALDLNDKITQGDIDRSTWQTRVISKYPALKQVKERVYPLWRAVSFGNLYDVGRKEVKDSMNHELLLNIIMQHLMFERLNRSEKVLEEESGYNYKFIDVDQSLLHALLKESVKKSERFYDLTIADKFPPNWLQKNKNLVVKEMDELLADLGLEDEHKQSAKATKDVNIWLEINSTEKENMIAETDPISQQQHFIAGSLNILVERLTSLYITNSISSLDEKSCEVFIRAFLITYMSFTTPEMLLNKLIQRFNVPRGAMLDLEYTTKKQQIQASVLDVIRRWITHHFSHFDTKLVIQLQNFLEDRVESEGFKKEATVIQNLISSKKYNTTITSEQQVVKAPDPKTPSNIFHPNLSIFDIDEEEVARQMTLVEFELFRAIEPQELLNQAWNKVKLRHRAPNVIKMIKHFNHASTWVASVLCLQMDLKKRITYLKKFIKICTQLNKMNNFSTLKAILNGLQSPAVERLKQTKDGLKNDIKNKWLELSNLITNAGMSNYQAYRQLVQQLLKQNNPIIPFMGVHQQDLQHIDENIHDYMRSEFNVELIHWRKCETIFDSIAEIQQMQNRKYNFIPVHQIQRILINMSERIDNTKALIDQSRQAEPSKI